MGVPRRWPAAARALLALGGGCLAGLAFPPHNLIPLLPIGIALLMLAVRRPEGEAPWRTARVGFGIGWLFGLGFMLTLMPWLRVIGIDAWIALSVIEAVAYGLMGTAWAAMARRPWAPVGMACTWVGAELLRSSVPFGGLPWGRLAFGLAGTPFDRYGRIGGVALVSFLAVLVVGLVVDAAVRRPRPGLLAGQVALAVLIAFGSVALPVGLAGAAGGVRVAAVQGNIPRVGLAAFAERWAVVTNHSVATRQFAARVAAGKERRPDFVVWPENSTDIDPFHAPRAYRLIASAVRAIGVPVLVGAVLDSPDPDHLLNTGIVWDPRTGPGERYVKQHLVPFGEYVPFRATLTKVISELNEIPEDFAPGHKPGVLHIGGVTIGDVICFEVAYDDVFREDIDGGARLLVVQTNNATYAGTGQLAQQFAMTRYRAIEAGRDIVVASTDGLSGVIAGDGSVLAESHVRTRVVFDREVTLATGITWGIRIGRWLDLGLALIGLGLAILCYLPIDRMRRAGLDRAAAPGRMAE